MNCSFWRRDRRHLVERVDRMLKLCPSKAGSDLIEHRNASRIRAPARTTFKRSGPSETRVFMDIIEVSIGIDNVLVSLQE